VTAAIAAGAFVVFLFAKNPLFDRVFSIGSEGEPALESVRIGPKPNQYLVLPEGWGSEKPHRVSPEFAMPAAELERRWNALVDAEPRVRRLTERTVAVRSRFWRFPDLVTVRAVPLGEETSAIAVYARALYGHSDLGVNKKRTDAWLSRLER
jgi:uncharacterized protein (DUF1499 family)